MKSIHMPALIRMSSMLETLKAQLKDGTPMGLDFCWNLATHCENITLNIIDDLYETGGVKDD